MSLEAKHKLDGEQCVCLKSLTRYKSKGLLSVFICSRAAERLLSELLRLGLANILGET